MSIVEKLLSWAVTAGVSMLPGLVNIALLRWWNRAWWHIRPLRLTAIVLPLAGAVLIFVWLLGMRIASPEVDRFLSMIVLIVYLPQLTLVPTLALTGLLQNLAAVIIRWRRRDTGAERPVDEGRRRFLHRATAAMPLLAAGGTVTALVEAWLPAQVHLVRVPMRGLPRDLDGYRILHLSDLHLAGYVTLDDLAGILDRARPFEPDLIALTGDIADNMRMLPEALGMIADFGAPDGAFAVLGNHEYGNDLDAALSAFADSRVPLLLDDGQRIRVGDASIWVGGITDHKSVRYAMGEPAFYAERVPLAFADARGDDFRLLLSHRPRAFEEAPANDVRLTLAGHTHGGQIVVANRTLVPRRTAGPWTRGLHREGRHAIYTSRGCGHWFPLRLGCRTEAPVIEVVQA